MQYKLGNDYKPPLSFRVHIPRTREDVGQSLPSVELQTFIDTFLLLCQFTSHGFNVYPDLPHRQSPYPADEWYLLRFAVRQVCVYNTDYYHNNSTCDDCNQVSQVNPHQLSNIAAGRGPGQLCHGRARAPPGPPEQEGASQLARGHLPMQLHERLVQLHHAFPQPRGAVQGSDNSVALLLPGTPPPSPTATWSKRMNMCRRLVLPTPPLPPPLQQQFHEGPQTFDVVTTSLTYYGAIQPEVSA